MARAVTNAEILALFDAQMRADPPAIVGVRHERIGSVVRSVGMWNVVDFWELSDADAREAVLEQARFARDNALRLEWKLYEHDRPAGLATLLQAEGFVPDEPETLMAFDLEDQLLETPCNARLEIRQALDIGGVRDVVSVSGAVFEEDHSPRVDPYVRSLADPKLALYVAYLDGHPVSSGRLQMPQGRAFASIWGGGTLPEYRGLGIYRALVAARAREARRRGYRFLTVDARESSRPILERLGFARLSAITGWVLRP